MMWPQFDLSEAINQAITGIVTLVAVLIGGWLAFKHGIRLAQKELVLDRRVRSLEVLYESLCLYGDYLRDAATTTTNLVAMNDFEASGSALATDLGLRAVYERGREESLTKAMALRPRIRSLMEARILHGDEWQALFGEPGACDYWFGIEYLLGPADADKLKRLSEHCRDVAQDAQSVRSELRGLLGIED